MWVYFDDQYAEHPKIDALSDGAFRLHTAAIFYSNRHATDGIITADRVRRLVPRFKRIHAQELVDRLLWHDLGDGAAYFIHDFLDWNKSKAQVEERRSEISQRRSDAGKKGAASRWSK